MYASLPAANAISKSSITRKRLLPGVLGTFAVYLAIALPIFFYQVQDYDHALRYGLLIPDTLNNAQTFDNMAMVNLPLYNSSNPGLGVLYGWIWNFAPQFCFLINACLMLLMLHLSHLLFRARLQLPHWVASGALLNPYLYLTLCGPNKEVPLIIATLVFILLLLDRPRFYPLYALATAAATYFIRDGYGAFLALFLFGYIVLRKPRAITISFLALLWGASAAYSLLRLFVPFIQRNYETAQGFDVAVGALTTALGLDADSVIGGAGLFAFRAIYNFLSLALLPQIFNENGEIFGVGLMYWVEGELILLTLTACAVAIFRHQENSRIGLLTAFCLSTLFMISVSTFVQPRYLIPILPISFGVFAAQPLAIRLRCVAAATGATFLIGYAYYLLGRSSLELLYVIPTNQLPTMLNFGLL